MAAAGSGKRQGESKELQEGSYSERVGGEGLSSDEEDLEYGLSYSSDEGEEELNDLRTSDAVIEAERRSERSREREEEEDGEEELEEEDVWNFPEDQEGWAEEDLGEIWADNWSDNVTVGCDPEDTDREEGQYVKKRPYYIPYRKFYPLIPDNHPDIASPEALVEELERMEEFLTWISYVFEDGSCYEGTVWDDLAHGKGVYMTPREVCRYEGEWFQNMMEGHGVLEFDLRVLEPLPGSREAKKLKARGHILKSDYLSSFDKEWLKMYIEDVAKEQEDLELPPPDEDSPNWKKSYGKNPEKGHYKYSGQWKHNRMHGCGVYEINARLIWGKFYFGELLHVQEECTLEQSAFHASLAEVAAAKARMFARKPDGMVREVKGPYDNPHHPYMYEEEDLWMAPGFINAYCQVPEVWKLYVEDVDREREMWLNSFIKSPMRIPMPPELEYWWSKNNEFVVLGRKAASPLKKKKTANVEEVDEDFEGDVLLHVPTGHIINWTTEENGQFRLFLQPFNKDGIVKPEEAIPLPLGFDEFMGVTDKTDEAVIKTKNFLEAFKEKWKETSKQMEQIWQQKEQIWQEEDLAVEERLRLKDADAQLTERIEDEEFEVNYREIFEELLERQDEIKESGEQTTEAKIVERIGGQGEEMKGHDKRPSDAAEEVYADEMKGHDKTPSNATEEVDEEEDGRGEEKPRSFGKVAMVDPLPPQGSQFRQMNGSLEKAKESAASSPTVFASLSLASHLVVKEVLCSCFCQVVQGLFPRGQPSQVKQNSGMGSDGISQISGGKRDVDCVHFSACKKKDFKLIAFSPRTWQHMTRKGRPFCKKSVKAFYQCEIAGLKCCNSKLDLASRYLFGIQNYFDSIDLWCEPIYKCLSMAVPLEI